MYEFDYSRVAGKQPKKLKISLCVCESDTKKTRNT